MLYQRRTFTVAAGAGSGAMCKAKGHSAVDARGKCLCCGKKVAPTAAEQAASIDGERQLDADSHSPPEPVGDEPIPSST